MPLKLPKPIIYLITSGATTPISTPASEDFQSVLALVRAAVRARIPLVQLREKNLTTGTLYELVARSVEITHGTETRLLINDRADVASATGAAGVHLAVQSLEAAVVRRAFGPSFLIGVSAHSPAEAQAARDGGADFAVFGPVFDTPSKHAYGAPLGLGALREAAHAVAPFPLVALGGITRANIPEVIAAGARGIAAIRLFGDESELDAVVNELGRSCGE